MVIAASSAYIAFTALLLTSGLRGKPTIGSLARMDTLHRLILICICLGAQSAGQPSCLGLAVVRDQQPAGARAARVRRIVAPRATLREGRLHKLERRRG